MNLGDTHRREKRRSVAFVLGLFFLALVSLPVLPSVHAAPQSPVSVVSTESSAKCYYANSLAGNSFTCGLKTTAGSTIVVFFGCLADLTAPCQSATVADSQSNTYSFITNAETSCAGATCNEESFWATASSTGNDTLTFATAKSAYLGGDAYDVLGINASGVATGYGGSSMDTSPSTFMTSTPKAGSFVAAGVIANDASQFTAGATFALIPGQPCFSCGGTNGGWQGSEYQAWGKSGMTLFPFEYTATNDGWAEVGLSFPPNVSSTSVSCAPSPVAVAMASKCTATEKGASPTGTIQWATNGTGTFSPTSCPLSSGSCSTSYTPSAPSPSVKVTASYGGDSNNPQSSGNYSLSAVKDVTTETIRCSPSPVAPGSPTTCTASVSGAAPTGMITWASSGVANFSPASTCTLSAGTCAVNYTPSSTISPITVTAIYGGDGDNTGVSATFQLAVSAASSTTSTSTTSVSTSTVSTSPTHSTTTAVTSSASSSSPTTSTTAASSSGSLALSPEYLAVLVVNAAVFLILGGLIKNGKNRRNWR